MAVKRTIATGSIATAAKWTDGTLPQAGDECHLDYANTLGTGETFDIGDGTLDLLGAGGGSLATTGVGTIVATGGVYAVDRLANTASTNLQINGDCFTRTNQYLDSVGVMVIQGGYTGGGGMANYGLKVSAGSLTVTSGISAEAGPPGMPGKAVYVNNATLVGDVEATASAGSAVELATGTILGNVRGVMTGTSSLGSSGVNNISGTLIGDVEGVTAGTNVDTRGVLNAGTIIGNVVGKAAGHGVGIINVGTSIITGQCTSMVGSSTVAGTLFAGIAATGQGIVDTKNLGVLYEITPESPYGQAAEAHGCNGGVIGVFTRPPAAPALVM